MPEDGNFKLQVSACCEVAEELLHKALEAEGAEENEPQSDD